MKKYAFKIALAIKKIACRIVLRLKEADPVGAADFSERSL
jgi:hypothetical protein